MDTEQLKQLANKNTTTQVVFNALKERRRLRHYTHLNRFKTHLVKSGSKVVDKEYTDLFKSLEEMGVGKVKGQRFEWFYSLKDIARGAFEDKRDMKVLKLNKAVKAKIERASKEDGIRISNKLIFIPLRTNIDVEIVVPNDLKKEEASAIYAALKRVAKSA